MTEINKIIGETIRRLRKVADISQTALGKQLDMTFQQIQKYEKGLNKVSAENLYHLANYFNVDIMEFFKGAKKKAKLEFEQSPFYVHCRDCQHEWVKFYCPIVVDEAVQIMETDPNCIKCGGKEVCVGKYPKVLEK